jgi:CheY-like chemotaxis protein
MRINKKRGRKSTLLIVDDEPLFRESIRALMSGLGQVKDYIKVVETDSAEKALNIFEACEFDYVIADIDMGRGRMNGYELTQTLLKKYPNTCVLIHSNKRKAEMDERIRMACHPSEGGDPLCSGDSRFRENDTRFMGFLPKPMKSSELLQFLACKSFESVCHPHEGGDPACSGDSRFRGNDKVNRIALPPTAVRNDGTSKTAILLNDDEGLLMYFGDDLKKLGYQVLDAKNVSGAMEHFVNRKIDMIVSDINLGDCEPTGYDFLAKVREKDTKVPFIFTSGYNRRDEWDKAQAAGATEYLQIPYELHELKKALGV